MINYLNTNTKLKKDNIYKFSLPVRKTCIGASDCLDYCYAKKGYYKIFESKVNSVRERNYKFSKSIIFVNAIIHEIKRRKLKIIRIHDSGDFYSQEYLDNWFMIANTLPEVRFYAYTKSLQLDFSLFKSLPNGKIIQSYGGKFDNEIVFSEPHARIFKNEENLVVNGYEDCSKSDLVALNTTNNKIGLIAH